MKAVILAGGDVSNYASLKPLVNGASLVIAADSGVRHASPLELHPHVIVGDFDSISASDMDVFASVAKVRVPPAKDELDLELALRYARERNAREVLVVGALGGRLDQSLAAVFIGAQYHQAKRSVSLHSGEQSLYFLAAPEVRHLNLPVGQTFSLLSLQQNARVSLQNALYDLDNATLGFGVGLGVSNAVKAFPLRLSVHEGLIALVVEWSLTQDSKDSPHEQA